MELGLNLAHLHLLLNHVPIIGWIAGISVLALGLVRKSDEVTRVGLAILFAVALIALPAYMTGYPAQTALDGRPDVLAERIERHQAAALLALTIMEIAGVVAWFGLWHRRRHARPKPWVMPSVLVLAVISAGLMSWAASIGGEIAHPEIRRAGSAQPIAWPLLLLSSANISRLVLDHRWVWPAAEVLHFMGLSLLFGVVLAVHLRLLGVTRHGAFGDVYRLLPWGVWAFVLQAATGMLFYIAQASQYMDNPSFHWKMILMLAAGANVLALTLFDDVWSLGPGDEAPLPVKLASLSQVVLWIGAIFFGRMLPYIGNAF
jgi:uncharacterized membrane protein